MVKKCLLRYPPTPPNLYISRIVSTISRVQKTLHGSSSDIGWLQQAPGMAPVKDGSARFMELLDCIRFLLFPFLFCSVLSDWTGHDVYI